MALVGEPRPVGVDEDRKRSLLLGDFGVAVGVGLLIGLLVSLVPLVSIALMVAGGILAGVSLARSDWRRAALASGVLVGSGALYLYGAINTVVACASDRCGDGNPWPLLAFSLVVFGLGILVGAKVAVRRH